VGCAALASLAGTSMVIAVPVPGALVSRSAPPTCRTRRRIPSSPKPGGAEASKPRPSSQMSRLTPPSW
jgi:hypothetical protein